MASVNLNTLGNMVKQGLDIQSLPEEIQGAVNTARDLTVDFEEENSQAAQLAARLMAVPETVKKLYAALPGTSNLKKAFLLEEDKRRMFIEHETEMSHLGHEKALAELSREYSRLENSLNRKISRAKTEGDIKKLEEEIRNTDFGKYADAVEEDPAGLFRQAIEDRKNELSPAWQADREAQARERRKTEFFDKQKSLLGRLKGRGSLSSKDFADLFGTETAEALKEKSQGLYPVAFEYLGIKFRRHVLYTDRYLFDRPKQTD